MTDVSDDSPRAQCEPYCDLFDRPGTGSDMELCDKCGAIWIVRQVTEVDAITKEATCIQHGWTRL